MNEELKPFVKWVGGKSRVSERLVNSVPPNWDPLRSTYYEPMVGSGALLLALRPAKAVINDLNEELILTYKALRDDEQYSGMLQLLSKYKKEHSEAKYEEIKMMDRDKNFVMEEAYVHGARLIYLNHTCFNGMWRVNRKGEFNTPSGKRKNPTLYDRSNLKNVHEYLKNNEVQIFNDDYNEVLRSAKAGDLVYFDPPYDGTYTSYTKTGFTSKDQEKLSKVFKALTDKGVYVMLTNSDTERVRELYRGFKTQSINVRHIVGAKKESRWESKELLITNY